MIIVAGLQVLLGAVGYVLLYSQGAWDSGTHGIWSIQLGVRLTAASFLILAGFGDRRTLLFGITSLLNATAFARAGYTQTVDSSGIFLLQLVAATPLDALFPLFFWRFARVFPEAFVSPSQDRALFWGEAISLALGLFIIASNLALFLYPELTALEPFSAANLEGAFSPVIYGLALPILVVLWLRMQSAREQERRRVRVFIFGLLVTIVPALVFIVLTGVSTTIRDFIVQDHIYVLVIPLMQALVLATPLITSYAVLVERILPVRLLLRQTLRYSLGNGFIVFAIALPLILLAFYLYNARSMSISALFDDYNGLFMAIALGISMAMLSQRHRARHYLEELFYRGRYDANDLLAELTQSINRCESLTDVARATRDTVSSALHPQTCHLLLPGGNDNFRDPLQELADLPLQSALGKQLMAASEPIGRREAVAIPGSEEERWLSQADASFLIPVRAQGRTRGVFAIGDKLSELPYTLPDLSFLELTLNTVILGSGHLLDVWEAEADNQSAYQCTQCGAVEANQEGCSACRGNAFTTSLLPKVLHGHYEVSRVLGGGGMGVVYLARDIELGRPVVLKSVAMSSAEELSFLRDEARLMATLSHPNIATIYRYESYQGTPILVCEYLEHGTLADVLRDGYLDQTEIFTITDQVLKALAYLHNRGIIHGDIKPSNIGFDAEETAKLLDFGLAKPPDTNELHAANGAVSGGTYAYMSPEKIHNRNVDQRADLWALAVTLFEAIHGTNPFLGADLPSTMARLDNPAGTLNGLEEEVSAFFHDALNHDLAKRPQSAEEFARLMRSSL